ncbi:MAG: thiamine pyrophosphate-dependent enzyme [Candidatus Nealsonbacteria bacterium]
MEILLNKSGEKIIMLGNEAIVRGALESGVQFVATYPGTPASEIGNLFYQIQNSEFKIPSLYFEFSVNEKIAMEAGMGASYSGLKTMVVMKNFGLNVASDPLLPFMYTGTKGPTVIMVADDPSCHSSAQSEENTRAFALLAHIPILEPSDAQECKDFIKLAFQVSEKYNLPVMVRTTTRVSHQKMPVKLGSLPVGKPAGAGNFVKDFNRFVTLPPRVLGMKKELLDKIAKIRTFTETSPVNQIIRGSDSNVGVITSGVAYLYVMEAMEKLSVSLPVLKIGSFYPLPEKKIQAFLNPPTGRLKKVLVVEELDPYLEKEIKVLVQKNNCRVQVVGKELLPEIGELKPEIVISALAKFANKKYAAPQFKEVPAPKRSPVLCPGCPYWLVISAVKKALQRGSGQAISDVIFGGEIGCYMLFGNSLINLQDYLACMGSSVGIGHGIKKALQRGSGQASKQKLISFVGDSSFFHSGIPALINTVFNKSNPLVIILNNDTTGMTGHQPYPGDAGIKIENIVQACGVKNLKVIDPANQVEFIQTIKEFVESSEVSVIIARRPCVFVSKKTKTV